MVIYIIYRNRNGFKNCFQTSPFTEIVKVSCKNMSNIYRNCKNVLQKSYLRNILIMPVKQTNNRQDFLFKHRDNKENPSPLKRANKRKSSLLNSVITEKMIFENNRHKQK